MDKNFFSQLLEKIGYLSAFAVAFSQYFLQDSFRVFFGADEKLYAVSSIFALLLSVLIIIAVFSSRYAINMKNYFPKKEKDKLLLSVKKGMEKAIPLDVPARVDMKIGTNWLEMECVA